MLGKIKQEAQKLISNIRQPFRGVLNSSNSSAEIQRHQVSGVADETLQDVEIYQQFGLTSNPPAGTKVIVVPLGGLTGHSVIIATENGNFRVKELSPGEVALYSSHGSTLIMKEGNIIDVDAKEINLAATKITGKAEDINLTATQSISLNAPIISLNGAINAGSGSAVGAKATISMPLDVKSKVTTDDDVVVAGKSFNNHTHPTPSGESDKPS